MKKRFTEEQIIGFLREARQGFERYAGPGSALAGGDHRPFF